MTSEVLISSGKWNRQKIVNFAKSLVKDINTTDDIKDEEYWKLYNNDFNEEDFEYLTKSGENYYPARMRHIPMQRHYVNSLISQQARRPFMFSTYLRDKKSVKEKYETMLMSVVKEYNIRIKQKHYLNISNIEEVEAQLQRIQERLQKKPENEQELKEQEQLRQAIPQIKAQINYVRDILKTEDVLTQQDIKKLDQYYKYKYKDWKEELAQKITLKGRKELDMKKKSTKSFISGVVTGKPMFFVDYEEGNDFPDYEVLSKGVYYPRINNLEFIQDGPWVVIEDYCSFQSIIEEYGDEISKYYSEEDLKGLMTDYGYSGDNAVFVSTPESGAMLSEEGVSNNEIDTSVSVKRQRVYFKVPRKINIKKSPNKYTKEEFSNITNSEKTLINKDEYHYKDKKYINKKTDKLVYNKDDVETYSKNSGDRIVKRYTNDLYQAVIIDGKYVVGANKKEVLRSVDKHSKILLPVFGWAFNNITDKPYSLIKATKGIQELYNIVHYHRELMMALSGSKGQVVDLKQKPADMTPQEWNYQKKQGNLYIETVDAVGRPINSSYNQWKDYDNTLSPSIQYLNVLLDNLQETMGNIMGIPRQRLGQTVASDQVGTTESSIKMSSLVTEIIFENHDTIEGKALSHWVNLTARYCLDKHDILDLDDAFYSGELTPIPEGIFKEVDLDVVMQNNTKEEQSLRELKQIYVQYAAKSNEPFNNLLSVYNVESVKELEKKLEYMGEKSEELRRMMAQSQGQNEMERESSKIKLEKEYDLQVQKMKSEIENMKLELEKSKMITNAELTKVELELQAKKQQDDKDLKLLELVNEQASETEVLEENRRSSKVDEKLRIIQTKMQAIEMALNKQSTDRDNSIKEKKVEVEDKKANKMVKEHVSDK